MAPRKVSQTKRQRETSSETVMPGVEGVAQHHVAEHQNDHDRQEQGDQDLQQLEVAFHDHVHRRFLYLASLLLFLERTRYID